MNTNEMILLALRHYQSGDLDRAEEVFRKTAELQSNNADVLFLLGMISAQRANYDLAIQYMEQALQLNPHTIEAYLPLGIAMQQKGRLDEAIYYYRKTVILNPTNPEAYRRLGIALKDKGLIDDAIEALKKSIEIDPGSAETHAALGDILHKTGQNNDAVACFIEAIHLDAHYIQAYYGLALALIDKGQLHEAMNICKSILEIDAANSTAYFILGNILMSQGRLNEAEAYFKQAMQIQPDDLKSNQAFLKLMSYHPKYSAQTIFSEHVNFARRFEAPLRSEIVPHKNARAADRRIRVGYISPDFKQHPVASFIEPVLICHNRDRFGILCYSDVAAPDEVTKRIKGYADQWTSIAGLSDAKVAEMLREDKIDILVDLAGHTGGVNRILLLARKPAPVQISWIGYLTTTGLSAIDYRIADMYSDPPGMTEKFYTEKLLRLPESFLCYLPDTNSPEVSKLPALTSGYITFGSLNNFVKISPEVITLWARILISVPRSRLILKTAGFSDKSIRQYAMDMFARHGITAERISLLSADPSPKHLESYSLVDIGLDTFPFNGGATTCEALWMGVPVITLAGTAYHSRVGASLLSNIGLRNFIADSENKYTDIAISLADDIEKLQFLRENLRTIMIQSPLMDGKRFILHLENCYQEIWQTWCKAN